MITVLIADDHPPTRAGVRDALVSSGGFEVVAEVGSAVDAVAAAREAKPDACLLDINMPGNGISAAAQISAELPDTAIVMLTVSRDDDDLFDALRAGASGYLLKDTDPDRLPLALRGVLDGEAALPRTLVAKLVGEFQDRTRRRIPLLQRPAGASLTPREWDVLEMLRDGLTTNEVAARLRVTPVTVRTHVAAILKKLQVPDRRAAFKLLDQSRS
ncbi:MAG TPA: response regulator transcription factor [Acidimicrobiales bacterium]|nr:response regulator transcription factor [Acidimicrobiales bacterium]